MQEKTGIEPRALKDRPSLSRRWVYPKLVFDDLSGSRRYTASGPANIPISEYGVYAKAYGITGHQWIEVWEDLSIVDTVWLSEIAKKQKAEQKST